jgi:hypothetical protein
MKAWKHVEPADEIGTPQEIVTTIEGILDLYFEFWAKRMYLEGSPLDKITLNNCIEDFIKTNDAVEVDYNPETGEVNEVGN